MTATAAFPDTAFLRRRLCDATSSDAFVSDGIEHDRPLVAAAVLVPFVMGPAPGVLLTRRGATLSSHAGQVSFPGGRIDPEDASPEAAALREAAEEIGLDPQQVELLGRLDPYVTGTGFRIVPVLGLLPDGMALHELDLRPSPVEVEAVFELPLAVLLDPEAPQRRTGTWRGNRREYWVWPHPQHHIWGATAAILVNLAARLRSDGLRSDGLRSDGLRGA